MRRLPPISTRTDTLLPYTTLFRSVYRNGIARDPGLRAGDQPLLPQKLVDEGGLACIRPADDGEFQRPVGAVFPLDVRSEEHTSELQSLMRISYAVFCLKKKNTGNTNY